MKSLGLVKLKFDGRLFLASLLLLTTTSGQPVADDTSMNNEPTKVIYDQKQNGKYNIRINIKDVAIIEMDNNGIGDESSSEDDYYYDEEDLTVKPLKLTTPTWATSPLTSIQPVTAELVQSNAGHMDIEEISELGTSTISKITRNPINMTESISDPQAWQTTTQQMNILHSKPWFIPTESFLPSPLSNTVESRSNHELSLKSSNKTKLGSNITWTGETSEQSLGNQKKSEKSEKMQFVSGKSLGLFPKIYHSRSCHKNKIQYRDGFGNCTYASFLKKLFRLIATLPFELE